MKQKSQIEKDFIAKRNNYYNNNYGKKTKLNYLRRLRNSIINKEVANVKNVEKVLDVGCGPAILYPELLKRSQNYFALDLVQSNLDKIMSQNSSKKIKYLKTDLDSFYPESNKYNLIICSGSLEYTNNPKLVIDKLVQSTAVDGTLIISLPNKNSPYRIWNQFVYKKIKWIVNFMIRRNSIEYERNLLTEKSILKVFDRGDNADISVKYFGVKLFLQPLDIIFKNLDYKIIKYFNDHPSKLLSKISQEFIITYKKKRNRNGP